MQLQTAFTALLLTATACCLGGCGRTTTTAKQYVVISELVATRDISSGSTVEKGDALFHNGKLYYKGEKPPTGPRLEPLPPDIFPGNWMGVIEGKKVARDLKKDEVVKNGDIVEPDGSPFQPPPGH